MKFARITHIILFSLLGTAVHVNAADLLSVYHDATNNSPQLATYLNTALATSQAVPINLGVLLPQVTGTAAIDANNVSANGVSASYNNHNYGLTITQQVFNYNNFANVSVAHYQKKSAMATYTSQQQQFTLSVAKAYFNVLTVEYDVSLAQSQYDFLKKTLEQTQAKFSAGIATYTDVAQARANMDNAYSTLIQSQNNLAIANVNLTTFTGIPETHLATITKAEQFPINPPNPQNVDYWVKLAQTQNPQLLAQQATESSALASVHANVGNQLPIVFVQANYEKNYYSSNVPSIVSFSTQTLDKSIELGLTWNIFSSGELMSQTLAAADQYVSQENSSTNLYRQTNSQTTQDYLSVMASIAQIQAYRQSEISALASLKQFDAEYKVGTATIVDVLNQVQALYQARFNLAQALNQYVQSVLSLKADVGTLSEKDLAEINQYLQVPQNNTVNAMS